MLFDILELHRKFNNSLHVRIGQRETLLTQKKTFQDKLSVLTTNADVAVKASAFLQTLSDQTRQQIIDKISGIVTDALQKIKDPNLEFKMALTTERNQVDVSFYVKNTITGQEYDILDSCGGSIADIVTYPLKISLLLKWEPTLSRVLILDENFKYVSVADQEPLGEFVRQVSDKLSLQTILVTHSPTVASKAHRVFEVTNEGTVSKVEERPA